MNAKKLAEQFSAMAALMEAISGTFRDGGSGAADSAGDGAPEKPVRGRKSKPATKAEITIETLREKLKELAAAKGKDKMADALQAVGAGRLPDVEEDQFQELSDAIDELMAAEDKPAPKGKAKTKPAGPTFEEVEAAFKELMASDRDAAKAVLKEAGLKKLSEVDQDDEGALADLMTAIEEANDLV